MSFRLLDHTADVRAEVEAPDTEALYQSAVDLVRHLVVGDSPVEERQERQLEIGGDDAEERFFRFVRELVYQVDSERFLPRSVHLGPPLRVEGERFDAERHEAERQLKAVTRHGYRLESGDDGLRAELVFDL
ncbi:MAG: archease [Thermoanaerobaculia bacterium]|nr:archease [Thermoanaerobaculia bacterium]